MFNCKWVNVGVKGFKIFFWILILELKFRLSDFRGDFIKMVLLFIFFILFDFKDKNDNCGIFWRKLRFFDWRLYLFIVNFFMFFMLFNVLYFILINWLLFKFSFLILVLLKIFDEIVKFENELFCKFNCCIGKFLNWVRLGKSLRFWFW